MKKKCFIGFDTSNYTTSAAVCDFDGEVVANLRIPLPVKEGERGLRQSDAVFSHIKNLPELCDALRDALEGYDVLAVGVSARPRSISGSYMPCFLSGISAAHAFAAASGVPVYEFSHQDGHVMAALYSSGERKHFALRQHLAFHVSGGTTEVLLSTPSKSGPFELLLVGETADLNAGQVIDRVGVMMGLSFPCGAELEKLAAEYSGKIKKAKLSVKYDGDKLVCNLSGVENLAAKIYSETGDKQAVAAFVFEHIGRTLEALCLSAMEKYGEMPVIFAGGVMSNKIMRGMLSARFDAYFAEPSFSADNAAGISLLCREKYNRK